MPRRRYSLRRRGFYTMSSDAFVGALGILMTQFDTAVVTVVVTVDPNTSVTVQGLRGNTTVMRSTSRGGLKNAVDGSAIVPASAFADPMKLPGCECTITDAAGVTIAGRLLPVKIHALAGLILLQIGEPDRVAQ